MSCPHSVRAGRLGWRRTVPSSKASRRVTSLCSRVKGFGSYSYSYSYSYSPFEHSSKSKSKSKKTRPEPSTREFPQNQGSVEPPEPPRVDEGCVHRHGSGFAGDEVQIAPLGRPIQ